ncbi:DEAD-box ATP-dependent RNA helicase 1-like isoform X2 [Nymphaea colorata]|uniref:DEAD-box ATP-dependent RNA helicase 1-like isoform X2 n=1 Tax=Nymphaea colorata TaxID=210225 RepID=UPI00214E18AA|nr:DEAD-box ATP-dependent RNA helicase 1-like isoform X2 [Nymphaea colorata]
MADYGDGNKLRRSTATDRMVNKGVEVFEESMGQNKSEPFLPWMRNPVDVDSYEECTLEVVPYLDPRLVKALQKMGINSLFPIQVAVWQGTIGPGGWERDLCINSPTGSGKTLAYALPIVQMLSTRKLKRLRALVVLPTRDLALQVMDVFSAIAPAVGLQVGIAVGQSSMAEEVSSLVQKPKFPMEFSCDPPDLCSSLTSSVDILVATPGRLMDHLNTTKGFTLEHLCYLVYSRKKKDVMEDVDVTNPNLPNLVTTPDDPSPMNEELPIALRKGTRLLRDAYQSWLPTVLQLTQMNEQQMLKYEGSPTFGPLRTLRRLGPGRGLWNKRYPRVMKMSLSATLTRDPSKLSQLNLYHPLFLTTGASGTRYQLPSQLESYKLLSGEKSIIFTSSVRSTHRLCTLLNCFGELPSKISEYSRLQHQSVRSITLDAFRAGNIQVIVASDAMTRGMDIEGVYNVINYDMPSYIKTYVHRAGRTARAGRPGRCFTLLRKDEVKRFKKMLQKAGISKCSVYPLASDSVERLMPVYSSALEKLKELADSEENKPASRRPAKTRATVKVGK